jgi:homoserine O-acetyltransferase/O-succinyltransferase
MDIIKDVQNIQSVYGPSHRKVSVGQVVYVAKDAPMMLDCGAEISDFPIAFQTYGTLNEDRSNAIVICHALTGDQYVASEHPVTGKDGWWSNMVGEGKPIDTSRFYVICSNVIGSCMGSFGPKSTNPATGKPYGLDFPVVTIHDMVRAQVLLLDALGVDTLHAVIGGSMGGMQALVWAAHYPNRLHKVMVIASAAKHSAQNIAFHEIGRQAIMADPEWFGGRYLEKLHFPEKGLAVARMTAHVTYLSEEVLGTKFGRNLQNKAQVEYGFNADFQIESYLRYQGKSFVERFDPNAYLYITRAMDYFDLAACAEGNLAKLFAGTDVKFCFISFTSDWLYATEESRAIVRALNGVAADVSFSELKTDKGHDAFLLPNDELEGMIGGFLG